jgi:polysaccharide biosynthesis/export protein
MLLKHHLIWTLACACALLLAPSLPAQTATNAAAKPQPQPQGLPPGAMSVDTTKYFLKPGDKVTLRVVESRDEPVVLSVSQGGEIEVPYLGRRLVMGKTIPVVQAELKAEYEKDYYYHATVQVSIDSINEIPIERTIRRIYVTGQVPTQGAQEVPYNETYTVSKAILRAGGLAPFANGRKVRVVRKGQDKKEEQITVDVLSILEDGQVQNDIELQPDDLIIVPEKLINW